jgi:hypothetical protein
MKNLHLFESLGQSKLVLDTKNNNLFITTTHFDNKLMKHMDVYITSNEPLKIGDKGWLIEFGDSTVCNFDVIESEEDFQYFNLSDRKIILTSDKDLIADGVQSIDDDFLEWFVKNPSCEGVEVEEIFNLGKSQVIENGKIEYTKAIIPISYKILIPNKQETLEEAAETWVFETNGHKWSNNDGTAGDNYGSFKKGAKWQAERMYSEEDMKLAFEAGHKKGFSGYPNTDTFKEFIQSLKQHKS